LFIIKASARPSELADKQLDDLLTALVGESGGDSESVSDYPERILGNLRNRSGKVEAST